MADVGPNTRAELRVRRTTPEQPESDQRDESDGVGDFHTRIVPTAPGAFIDLDQRPVIIGLTANTINTHGSTIITATTRNSAHASRSQRVRLL